MKTSRLRKSVGYVILLLCALLAGWLLLNQRYVIDQLTVWQYHPEADITSLTERTDMSDKGRFLFYASQPTVDGTQAFNQYCKKSEPQSAILGCYKDLKIYIYKVSDDKLDGIEEVTAAHEMLHAAWDRLGSGEKDHLSQLLEAEYQKLNNKDLKTRMDYYARTEPTERTNELHSILGTEFAHLSPELEKYYDQYFTNRTALVALHDKYESVFDELKDKGASLSAQLKQLAADINKRTKSYNAAVGELNSDITQFNQRAENGSFQSRSQFENERAGLVSRLDALDTERKAINAKVATYHKIRKELEAVNSQSEALNNSIDSSLAPAPSSV